MKVLIFMLCVLMLAVSCQRSRKKVFPQSVKADSLTVQTDSVQDISLVEEEVIPPTVDENFADFLYNFASEAAFQKSRIVFPFPFYGEKEVVRVERDEWKFDPMFSLEPAYTVLFDSEEDMEMEKDTSMRSVQIDWIYLADNKIKRYYFEKKKQSWFLEAVNVEELTTEDSTKEDFMAFYRKFSCDSLFQMERLAKSLAFVTIDPEDEFSILDTIMDKEQWFAFRPPMMDKQLTNVHYGQPGDKDSDSKIVEFKGFGNGFSNTLHFSRKDGIWKLVKFEDLSD